MASEDYVAIKSEQLSAAAGDERYVVVNRWTREVVDNCNGHGYKSAMAAHKSWAYKQRQRNQRQGGQQGIGNHTGGNRSNGYRQHGGNYQQGGWRLSYRSAADPNGTPSQQRSQTNNQPTYGVHAYRSTPDGRGMATNRYQTQRRRPQDVSQENTPPPPDLFDFQNK